MLNTGAAVEARVEFIPRYHDLDRLDFLRIRNLPVNELADSVMVLKLEFDSFVGEGLVPSQVRVM